MRKLCCRLTADRWQKPESIERKFRFIAVTDLYTSKYIKVYLIFVDIYRILLHNLCIYQYSILPTVLHIPEST